MMHWSPIIPITRVVCNLKTNVTDDIIIGYETIAWLSDDLRTRLWIKQDLTNNECTLSITQLRLGREIYKETYKNLLIDDAKSMIINKLALINNKD